MKRLLIAVSMLLVAAAAAAADTATQPATATADSPLVRAAKSARKPAKKSIVITDEMLKTSKGHVTTTKGSMPLPAVPPAAAAAPEAQPAVAAAKAADAAAEQKAAEEKRKRRMERLAAEQVDQGQYSEMDPALIEHEIEKEANPAPPPAEPKKP